MRFLTQEETRDFYLGWGRKLTSYGEPEMGGEEWFTVQLKLEERTAFVAQLVRVLDLSRGGLLWITEWGVWPSSENLHLFYRLRASYGEPRMVWEAPGQMFLGYEQADLLSLLQVVILNGWDAYVIPDLDYARLFVSHDGYALVAFGAEEPRDEFETWMASFGAKVKPRV